MTIPDTALHLNGLSVAPAQVCGGVRLIPLIRQRECRDVRLELRRYREQIGRVQLNDGSDYWAFVPHGLVLRWGEGDELESAMGSQLKKTDGKTQDVGWFSVNTLHRMVKRESKNALRMLPLHLALEGFLALHFGGPKVAWKEYSRSVLSQGLGERSESAVPGAALPGFEDALKTFEIHDGQVGVLVYVADKLASAFVVPSSQDYRALHYTLLSDYFGELIGRYALLYSHSPELGATPDTSQARTLADLRIALDGARQHWADFAHTSMLGDLVGRPLSRQKIYDVGGMRLERFMTDLNLEQTNTIGECLTRDDGELLYLKTFQLSRAQSERGWLLGLLAAADWHLESAAQSAGLSVNGLILRLDGAGFGYLLKPHLIEAARRKGI
ncbi:hypothetical protein [Deinococcus sp.]|uniref:ARPP-2 domain-containing protein n=1 Tax=Deinococcus sp. TaxID=47478 RepID=UPI0025CC3069|nr:hypothetical protein [Deinococcus sp.]